MSTATSLLVLYGSQTGTAEDMANRLARNGKRRGYTGIRNMAMNDYDKSRLIFEKLVVFICSTTGQGEEPDSMKSFWKFLLRKQLPPDSLSEVKIAVFGLGDSSYSRFNFAAKKLYRRLLQLGAQSMIELGLGDDQAPFGIDETWEDWETRLWTIIENLFPPNPEAPRLEKSTLLDPSYRFEYPFETSTQDLNDSIDEVGEFRRGYDSKTFVEESACGLRRGYPVNLMLNQRLTVEDHFQDVRHIEFDISKTSIHYEPGDVVYVTPRNRIEDVDEFIERMGIQEVASKPILIKRSEDDSYDFRHIRSIKQLIEEVLDIFSVPRKSFFEWLVHFASDSMEKEKLEEFISKEGQESLYSYCYRTRRTCFEVLQDFPSIQIPVDYYLDVFPKLKARPFSISSSWRMYPHRIHITAAVVQYRTKLVKPRSGICTKWLASLRPSDNPPICLWTAKGTFKMPSDVIPLILIGPGTGCAAVRAIIQDRVHRGVGEMFFFFGCRSQLKDFLYQTEWNEYVKQGYLHLFTAFSRDQHEKVYVQHRLREHADLVWKLIEKRRATIFITGSARQMPKDVQKTLKDIAREKGGMIEGDDDTWWQNMETQGRIQIETWY